MNYYEQRISQLDKKTLPIQIFGDGRDIKLSNDDFWKKIKKGDKIYPTVWFLRNVHEIPLVKELAENGLTVEEKGSITDSEGAWRMGRWVECEFNCLWFKETVSPMSFKHCINQQIWKINDEVLQPFLFKTV
jgi:hypothetical protein